MSENVEVEESEICKYSFRTCNPKNQWITAKHLQSIFKKFGIKAKIGDIETYRRAFVHNTYTVPTEDKISEMPELSQDELKAGIEDFKKSVPLQPVSYDRLECLGDRVLDMVVLDYIFHRYPDMDQGDLTKLKTKLVRDTSLCILAKKLKFDRYILVSKKNDHYRVKESVLEDVFEAFLGALYSDLGKRGKAFEVCKDLVIGLMERYVNFNQLVRRNDNYKDLLLQFYHSNFKKDNGMGVDPEYKIVSVHGPTNNRTFKAGVKNPDGHVICTGEGSKLVYAEQMAAKEALKYYGEEVYSDTEEPTQDVYSDSESDEL